MRGAGCSMRLVYRLCLACVILAGVGVLAHAQRPQDTTPDDQPPKYFSLDRLDAYLELEAEFYQTRVRSHPRYRSGKERSQTNRDLDFRERVGFSLAGSLLGQDVITYHGDLSFALTQSRFKERGTGFRDSDHDTGYLAEYDLRLNFFPGKILSGSVYGLRQDDRITRRFQPTLDERRTGFGGSLYFAHDRLPMELTYDYLETDRTGNRDNLDDEHFTESTLNYRAEWIVSEHHRFKFSYEHAETKQEYQGLRRPFETTRDLFIMEQELEFGNRHEHTLRNLVHWQEESGDFARDYFRIGPQLTLQHTDNLQTMYKYQFNRERYAGFDVESHRGEFQFVHQLYTNLVTTVTLFGEHEKYDDDVDMTEYGASADWQYNRKNPLGHFYANLAVGYDTQEVNGNDGLRVVLNESGTFRDPRPVILRNRNVVQSSIVITDATDHRVYLRGVDYFVSERRDAIFLTRLPTGRIDDGDTVFIDYLYRTPAGGQIDTVRVDFNLEQQFDNGLTPYYRFSYRNQENDYSTGFAQYADRTDHHRIGARFEAKRYSLGAEFEVFDDTVEPFDAFHLDGLFHLLQAPENSLEASTRLSHYCFESDFDDRDVTIVDVEVDHHWQPHKDLSTFERLSFRWQDDSVAGITRGWSAEAGVEYVMGLFTAELSVEYDRLEIPGSREDDTGIYLRLRRDIPNVLAKW